MGRDEFSSVSLCALRIDLTAELATPLTVPIEVNAKIIWRTEDVDFPIRIPILNKFSVTLSRSNRAPRITNQNTYLIETLIASPKIPWGPLQIAVTS